MWVADLPEGHGRFPCIETSGPTYFAPVGGRDVGVRRHLAGAGEASRSPGLGAVLLQERRRLQRRDRMNMRLGTASRGRSRRSWCLGRSCRSWCASVGQARLRRQRRSSSMVLGRGSRLIIVADLHERQPVAGRLGRQLPKQVSHDLLVCGFGRRTFAVVFLNPCCMACSLRIAPARSLCIRPRR